MLEIFPDATIFKPGPLVGQEDKLYNTYAKMGKALPIFPLIGGGTARRQVCARVCKLAAAEPVCLAVSAQALCCWQLAWAQ